MTDRLADLQSGERFSTAIVETDIEAGLDEESERLHQGFNHESIAIEKLLTWADGIISSVSVSLSVGSAPSTTEELEKVETKLHEVRRRLEKMADDNRSFAAENSSRLATVRTRLVRYTKLGKDFLSVTGRLAETKEWYKGSLTASLKQAVLDVNPNASERAVDAALRNSDQLESVLGDRDSSEMRHQIHARSAAIQQLVKSIADLNQMFRDMSILVEMQQTLINDVEYNVQRVKEDVKEVGEEVVEASRHQKSKNKKKMYSMLLVSVIIAIIVISITVPIVTRANPSNAFTAPSPDPL